MVSLLNKLQIHATEMGNEIDRIKYVSSSKMYYLMLRYLRVNGFRGSVVYHSENVKNF